ncbi:MAG: hypothetical protein BRC39_12705 [Cyanobacteria bacterium QH_7_48_89]|nr:MAG: hypothetical protein BRC39_12705 [Cyanobacteria bacterium QH_7_48_89]
MNLNQPYRQRSLVLKPAEQPQQLTVQYLALKQPEKFRGAGAESQKLQPLGCRLGEFTRLCSHCEQVSASFFRDSPSLLRSN